MIKGYSGVFRLGEATSTWDADSPVCLSSLNTSISHYSQVNCMLLLVNATKSRDSVVHILTYRLNLYIILSAISLNLVWWMTLFGLVPRNYCCQLCVF